MSISLPYTEDELILELIVLIGKCSEEKTDKMTIFTNKLVSAMPQNKKSANIAIADDNGISVKGLINSPNYERLYEEYTDSLMKDFVGQIEKELEFTNKQSWAIIAKMFGYIKF